MRPDDESSRQPSEASEASEAFETYGTSGSAGSGRSEAPEARGVPETPQTPETPDAPVAPGAPGPSDGGRAATALVVLWTVLLLLLAYLWVQSPFTGPGPMFQVWSLVAVPLVVWSWSRARRWEVRQVPRSTTFLLALGLVWIGFGMLSGAAFPGVMALDGLLLREPMIRWTGRTLQWLPGLFGLALSVAGLVGALEIRYRVVHR